MTDQIETLDAELAEYDWCEQCGVLARVCDLNPHGCEDGLNEEDRAA